MVKRDLIKYVILSVVGILTIISLHLFVFSYYTVADSEGNSFLKSGDVLLVNRTKIPEDKAFVIYEVDGKRHLGRVVAKENDSVTYMDDIFYKNNKVESQSYLESLRSRYVKAHPTDPFFTQDFTIVSVTNGQHSVIPKGYYLILNDNRQNLSDSRQFGLIEANQIKGVTVFKVSPLSDFGFVKSE